MPSRKVAVIIPSTNTTVEAELVKHLPEGASLHAGRMYMPPTGGPNAEADMLDVYLPQTIKEIASLGPDMVLFACTSAGTSRGPGFEAELVQRLQAETGAPAAAIMGSVEDELHRLGAKTVAVVTPYTDAANQNIKAALEAKGFSVAAMGGMAVSPPTAIANVTAEDLAAFGKSVLGDADVDAVFISCTALFTLDAMPAFESAFGKPVVSSLSAGLSAIERGLAAGVA